MDEVHHGREEGQRDQQGEEAQARRPVLGRAARVGRRDHAKQRHRDRCVDRHLAQALRLDARQVDQPERLHDQFAQHLVDRERVVDQDEQEDRAEGQIERLARPARELEQEADQEQRLGGAEELPDADVRIEREARIARPSVQAVADAVVVAGVEHDQHEVAGEQAEQPADQRRIGQRLLQREVP